MDIKLTLESGVLSILNYHGSEIWGFGNFPKCDSIMTRAMRYFMGVHRFGPTDGVQGDMGWMSLRYRRYIVILEPSGESRLNPD